MQGTVRDEPKEIVFGTGVYNGVDQRLKRLLQRGHINPLPWLANADREKRSYRFLNQLPI